MSLKQKKAPDWIQNAVGPENAADIAKLVDYANTSPLKQQVTGLSQSQANNLSAALEQRGYEVSKPVKKESGWAFGFSKREGGEKLKNPFLTEFNH